MNFKKFKVKDLLTERGYALYKVDEVHDNGLKITFYSRVNSQEWRGKQYYIDFKDLREVKKQELDRFIYEFKPPKWVIQKLLDKL